MWGLREWKFHFNNDSDVYCTMWISFTVTCAWRAGNIKVK